MRVIKVHHRRQKPA